MAIRFWECKCGVKEKFFDYEEKKCTNCGNCDLVRLISLPLSAKITDKVDKIHNVDMEKGIEEDLKTRNKRHVLDTIDEFIAEFGEQQAKEIGLLVSDDNGRTWRKKNRFESGLTNSTNKGSPTDG